MEDADDRGCDRHSDIPSADNDTVSSHKRPPERLPHSLRGDPHLGNDSYFHILDGHGLP